jgi:excisionase family DNA binding protein
MNADDHARAKAFTADLQEVQQILRRWADENQALADENERLRTQKTNLKPQPAPKATDPLYLTPKQLADRWAMHNGSILRKIRNGDLPRLRIGRRIRIAMADVLAEETQNHFRAKN